jgi:hypothetical protein
MTGIFFLLGYFGIAVAAVNELSRNDPEPIGAAASLAIFALFGAIISLVGLLNRSYALGRFPNKFSTTIAGAVSSTGFFFTFMVLLPSRSLWISVSVALATSFVAAATWPYISQLQKHRPKAPIPLD